METLKTFPIKMTEGQHSEIQRKARAAKLPMYQYILYMSIDGKLPKRAK
jgi:hypothetical protein